MGNYVTQCYNTQGLPLEHWLLLWGAGCGGKEKSTSPSLHKRPSSDLHTIFKIHWYQPYASAYTYIIRRGRSGDVETETLKSTILAIYQFLITIIVSREEEEEEERVTAT
jgi:hypothetical protein